MPREELYETVWGAPLRAGDRSVDVYVHKLRVKLEEALPEWRFIHTHFGFGYRLQPERFTRLFTTRSQAGNRTRRVPRGPASDDNDKEEFDESTAIHGCARPGGGVLARRRCRLRQRATTTAAAAERQRRRRLEAQLGGTLNGAGATFPQPVYQRVGGRASRSKAGTTVNYQGIGSGGGVAQFTAGTVDFGATDSAMKRRGDRGAPRRRATRSTSRPCSARSPSPTTSSGVEEGLKLDGATIADIFLGKITKWNDPAIAAQNPGVELPDADITVCHRSDESGTTKNFTAVPRRLLARVEERARASTRPSSGRPAPAPRATTASRPASSRTEGSIGYVEQAYALQNNFTFADVKNKAGQLHRADAGGDLGRRRGRRRSRRTCASARSTRQGDEAYPIAAVTFLLVYQDMCKAGLAADKAKPLKGWLDYALGDGQERREGAPVRAAARRRHSPRPRPRSTA